MVEVAFWMAVVSLAVVIGLTIYVVRTMESYRKYMGRIGVDVTEMATIQKMQLEKKEMERVLAEMKEWQSLFVRMIFEAFRQVETKLDEGFWNDLRDKYPDLKIFPAREKKEPEQVPSQEPEKELEPESKPRLEIQPESKSISELVPETAIASDIDPKKHPEINSYADLKVSSRLD